MKSLRIHVRETARLAYPVSIGQIGYIMMGVVDSAMVGQIGYDYLAAASLANGIFFLTLVVGVGISNAVTPLVAISIGANRREEHEDLFKNSFYINLISGIALSSFTFLLAEGIALLNQPKEVVELAIPYTKILGVSLIPIMIFQSYKQFIEGMSIVRPAMVITLLANIVNAASNYVYIYGNFGFPRMELNGAGLATFTSRTFMLVLLIYFLKRKPLKFNTKFNIIPFSVNKIIVKKLLSIGIPSGLQFFFEAGAFTFAAFMIGWLGSKDLAAHQIAITIASITYMIVLGISTSSAIRVGNAVGAQSISETRRAGFAALLMGGIVMLFFALNFILLNQLLPKLFVNEFEVLELAASLLIIAAFFQLFDGVQAVGLGILRGLTDVKFPTAVTFFSYWIIGIPFGYYLGFGRELGVVGVWIGLSVGLATSASLLTFRFNAKSKRHIHQNR
ncbi:MAG: MATE family efflux transporter [Ignavibacteriaceae bacterium]|nr:MATE family efflux transporter [Ignavibacteriaceae bacterium]